MDSHRLGVTDFVHVGLVVEDLDEQRGSSALLGFDCGEPWGAQRRSIDRTIGLENATVEVVMAQAPTGPTCSRWCASTRLPPGPRAAPRQPSGAPALAFKVDDVRGVVDRVQGQLDRSGTYRLRDMFLLCYVRDRGPDRRARRAARRRARLNCARCSALEARFRAGGTPTRVTAPAPRTRRSRTWRGRRASGRRPPSGRRCGRGRWLRTIR